MALGASSSHVLTSVLQQFSLPVGGGSLAGVGAAAALSLILRRALFGVSNLDPAAWTNSTSRRSTSATLAKCTGSPSICRATSRLRRTLIAASFWIAFLVSLWRMRARILVVPRE